MERMRTTLLLLLVVGLASMTVVAAVEAGATATPAQTPAAAAPAIIAAGEPSCSSCLKCPCGCSPLAGAWVAKLSCEPSKSSSWSDETIIQTFKFAPINEGCTKFVVNSEAATRLAKVAKFWPDACDQTEFVGIACKDEWKDIKLTAISYGVKRCAVSPTRAGGVVGEASSELTSSPTTCPTTKDKVVFIAVMTARIEIPESCLECDDTGKYNPDPKDSDRNDKDEDGKYTGECKEPKELKATIFVSYFDAAQDVDRDGFPDWECDEAVLCVRCETCLKRVDLKEPCEAESKSFTACLAACEDVKTAATGRAFVTIDEGEQDVDVVVTVKDLKDVKKAALQIDRADVLVVFTSSKGEVCDGLLTCAEFTAKDFIGPLKGKKIEDLLKAIEEGKVTVVVSTTEFPNGEICGKVEDS